MSFLLFKDTFLVVMIIFLTIINVLCLSLRRGFTTVFRFSRIRVFNVTWSIKNVDNYRGKLLNSSLTIKLWSWLKKFLGKTCVRIIYGLSINKKCGESYFLGVEKGQKETLRLISWESSFLLGVNFFLPKGLSCASKSQKVLRKG